MAKIVKLTSVKPGGASTGQPYNGRGYGKEISLTQLGDGTPRPDDHVVALKLRDRWWYTSPPKRLKQEPS